MSLDTTGEPRRVRRAASQDASATRDAFGPRDAIGPRDVARQHEASRVEMLIDIMKK
jgi:hypothetical protein